mgnify:CR=1 FL=1
MIPAPQRRPVSPQTLAVIHAASFGRGGPDDARAVGRAWTPSEFATLLGDPHVFLCPAPGGASGFALGRAVAGEAEILTLAVAPHARRNGVGRALVAGFEAAARERGAERAFLEVAADNAGALALYAGAGYVEQGRRPGYYAGPDGAPVAALILGRALA